MPLPLKKARMASVSLLTGKSISSHSKDSGSTPSVTVLSLHTARVLILSHAVNANHSFINWFIRAKEGTNIIIFFGFMASAIHNAVAVFPLPHAITI